MIGSFEIIHKNVFQESKYNVLGLRIGDLSIMNTDNIIKKNVQI